MEEKRTRTLGPKGCAKRIRETAEKFNALIDHAKGLGLAAEVDYREGKVVIGEINYEQKL